MSKILIPPSIMAPKTHHSPSLVPREGWNDKFTYRKNLNNWIVGQAVQNFLLPWGGGGGAKTLKNLLSKKNLRERSSGPWLRR